MGDVHSDAPAAAEVLRRLYVDEGLTLEEIGALLGVSPQTVSNRLRRTSIAARSSPSMPRLDVDGREVARLYSEEGMSAPAIARALGCGVSTLYSRLDAAGVPRRATGGGRSRRPPGETLRVLYVSEERPVRAIADEFRVTRQAVYGWLRDAGIGLRDDDVRATVDAPEVVSRYRAGETGPELARAFGCSPASIYRLLDEHGIDRVAFRAIGRADLLAGLDAGWSAPQIAEAHGIGVTAVCRALTREGLETARQAELRARRTRTSA